nr:hypothetical protein [uncultured Mucilaginibacter sp.]
MKKALLFLILPCFLVAASCTKAILEDNGCISEYKRPLNPIGDAAYSKVKALFQKNSISYDGLSFYRATFDDTVALGGTPYVYQHTLALQYFNGLPVLNGDIGYHFGGEVFTSVIGTKYNTVNLSTSKNLSLAQVRKLFLNVLEQPGLISNKAYKDSCLSAEFGYYILNLSSVATSPQIVKAWKVTPEGKEYPVGYFRDDNAATISYFDGIYTIK